VAASYRYDSYGNRQVTGSAVQPYGFTGREHDNESGLIYLRARQYDPATGVFMQSDPIGLASAETNLHTYVRNNPTNWTDPTGLMATIECQTGSQSGGACGSMAGLTSPILNSTSMLAMAIAMEIANMSNEEWRKNGTPPPSGHNSGGQEPPEPPQPPIPFIPYIPDRSNDPSFNPPTTAGPDQWDAPTNLFTQLAWLDVLLGGGVGRPLNLNNDPIFHASNGWQKMHYTRTSSSGESVTFHYQYNSRTGQIADIKIIGYSPPN
jgi:RHS repeat-associated protein